MLTCLLMLLLFGTLISLLIRAQWTFIAHQEYDETLDLFVIASRTIQWKVALNFFWCFITWQSVFSHERLNCKCCWHLLLFGKFSFLCVVGGGLSESELLACCSVNFAVSSETIPTTIKPGFHFYRYLYLLGWFCCPNTE